MHPERSEVYRLRRELEAAHEELEALRGADVQPLSVRAVFAIAAREVQECAERSGNPDEAISSLVERAAP